MARNNRFQHETVLGSAYYNPVTQPLPWDRMRAEGYAWNSAAENIAAGYSGAEAAYVGWWTLLVAKLLVVFYGCELILSRVRTRWNPLNVSTLTTLSVLGFRGLL